MVHLLRKLIERPAAMRSLGRIPQSVFSGVAFLSILMASFPALTHSIVIFVENSPSHGPTPVQPSTIIVKDNRISISVNNRSLMWVLEEISRKSGVSIMPIMQGGGNPSVSLQLVELPIDQALRQVLKGYDLFFFYSDDAKSPTSLQVVWVYPKGTGRGLMPVPPELWASTKEIEQRFNDHDPAVRARAIEMLVGRKGAGALDAVLSALKDEHEQVRTQALYGSVVAGVVLPHEALTSLVQNDPSSDIRFLALQALASAPNAGALAESALNDPSPHVQNAAKEILNRLNFPPPQEPSRREGQPSRQPNQQRQKQSSGQQP